MVKKKTDETSKIVATPEPIKKAKLKQTIKEEAVTAKAGKRSVKAIEEKEAKQAKEERKKDKVELSKDESKPTIPATRTLLERRSKAYKQTVAVIEIGKLYSLEEATTVIKKMSPVKFDATVELHVRLAVDPRQADQNIRDNVVLPAGSGKTIRVAAFVNEEDMAVAKKAGAELIGEAAVIKVLESGSFNFDVLVATPSQMPKLGKYARLLGPRGLMPNPKSGTVTTDITKAITDAKAGKIEYRVDSGGIIHVGVGKVSFKPAQLLENLQAVLASIKANRPASIKANYVISAYLTTSMGPSIKIAI